MNFLGSQPKRDETGPLLMNLYGELVNPEWRFRFGQQFDVFSPLSPTTVNFLRQRGAGNVGIFRSALRADRFIKQDDDVEWTLTMALSQQDVNDFLINPAVRGSDNGWPNIEGRAGVAVGEKYKKRVTTV